ncbi:hypothetical protein CAC42_2953 [Sphaceloma murrayae]|uniref:Endonuclease/exonuclease/phosphatase domain-containing protein n=1 Tax=Sphaceloma murrayae TaxID=2082308 RepID=A0A2K1R081_9PEZI|nr:hypothetical protein CAC42_2953 [Sphaceloma murrayae]
MQILSTGLLALRVLTHNIRYAADPPSTGEAPWPQRLPDLLAQFRYETHYAPQTFICMQEVLDNQLTDILDGLNQGSNTWASIGLGRDDGARAGEYSPILYQPSIWDLRQFEYYWLSETPDRPSRGWDAGSVRIVTIGVFRDKVTSRDIVAINTHLDNAGTVAREEGSKLLVETVTSYVHGTANATYGPLPVFLAGDMNSQESQEAYGVLTGSGSPLKDVKTVVPPGNIYGYNETFTGFTGDGEGRIDYVFATQTLESDWIGNGYATLPNIFEDGSGLYFSDHRAVVADIGLRPPV